jgi:ribose 5-phosphate isomerase RpiB
MKVVIFRNHQTVELSDNVNKWLASKGDTIEVIDILQSQSTAQINNSRVFREVYVTITIWYKEK